MLALRLPFGGKRLDGSTALRCGDAVVHSHFFGQSSFATHTVVPERTAVKVDRDLPLEKLGPLGCGVITGAGAVIEALQVSDELDAIEELCGRPAAEEAIDKVIAVVRSRLAELPDRSWYAFWSGGPGA